MGVAGMTLDKTESGETSTTSPRRKALQNMARCEEEGRIGGSLNISRRTGEEIHLDLEGFISKYWMISPDQELHPHHSGFHVQSTEKERKGHNRRGGPYYAFLHGC
jgi:hypothetical protein